MRSKVWYWAKSLVPLVKPFPIQTFGGRLLHKWRTVSKNLIHRALVELRLRGCTPVGIELSGNSILKLNVTNSLGKRGDLIQIPIDKGIYPNIRFRAEWELEECTFLSNQLKRIANGNGSGDGTFLDIGANAGWVTIQTLRLTNTRPRTILVEPIPRHLDAIRFNTRRIFPEGELEILPFALSSTNGLASIYTEDFNHGNSSLNRSIVTTERMIETQINTRKTSEFCDEYLSHDEAIVIKCDIQGEDAAVLAQFPEKVWAKTRAAVVEIWAIDDLDPIAIEKCLQYWGLFTSRSWSFYQPQQIALSEISEFWLSKSKESRNLFLSM